METWRNNLSKPHKELRARARTLSTASAVSLCPPPLTPVPAPGRVLMRPVQGEAGEEAMPTGASRSSRGGHTQAWRHPAPACLLCPHGTVAGTPLGWGGGPSHVWAPPRPRPGDPASVSQRLHSFPLRIPGRGRRGRWGRWGSGVPGLARRAKLRASAGGGEV